MDLRTWVETAVVVFVVVMVASLAIVWERDRRSSSNARPTDGRLRLSPGVLVLIPAVLVGYLVGAGQWLLAVVASIAGVVLRLAGERHERRLGTNEPMLSPKNEPE